MIEGQPKQPLNTAQDHRSDGHHQFPSSQRSGVSSPDDRASLLQTNTAAEAVQSTLSSLLAHYSFLLTVIDALDHPFYVIDAKDYSIVLQNSAARRLGPAYGLKCFSATHRRDSPCCGEALQCPMEAIKRTKQSATVEHTHFDWEGNPIYVEVHAHPIFSQSGELEGIIEFCIDITARKTLEEAQKRYQEREQQSRRVESLGMLASGLAHDFNNVLTEILGSAELALLALPAGAAAVRELQVIKEAALKASRVTEKIVAYCGQSFLLPVTLELSSYLESEVNELTSSLTRNISIEFAPSTNACPVRADPAFLRRIFLSLISNAVEAITPDQGRIVVRVGASSVRVSEVLDPESHIPLPAGHYCWFEVSDSGCGMSRDTAEKLFSPFFSTKFIGRGLNLSASLGIVRKLGGTIIFESREGAGSSFKVLLPLAEESTT